MITTYQTTGRAALTIPGRRPHVICGARRDLHICTRSKGHRLRHAHIWWWAGSIRSGVMRAVWPAAD